MLVLVPAAETGIQDPQIFTGPGTGGCGPGNNETEPFTYRMQVNKVGRYTYNDGCNPETTLGILWVLPLRKSHVFSRVRSAVFSKDLSMIHRYQPVYVTMLWALPLAH